MKSPWLAASFGDPGWTSPKAQRATLPFFPAELPILSATCSPPGESRQSPPSAFSFVRATCNYWLLVARRTTRAGLIHSVLQGVHLVPYIELHVAHLLPDRPYRAPPVRTWAQGLGALGPFDPQRLLGTSAASTNQDSARAGDEGGLRASRAPQRSFTASATRLTTKSPTSHATKSGVPTGPAVVAAKATINRLNVTTTITATSGRRFRATAATTKPYPDGSQLKSEERTAP